ncbi:MAG: replication-associated recombination protein A [Marinicaulis sp.]|nr:replication-associated recombination protein A [Marinicaulis sp.]NNE42431.1 replication-associated recombination protein A [Marinicaulis sp.]NNL88716.1 replication-associated recombination protein A [Marinicaulis sp.]
MSDLFQSAGFEKDAPHPLADRARPQRLSEVVGQDHLLGPGAPIRRMLDAGRLSSLVLWGAPGVGKTTIARLLATEADLEFEQISAIFSGVADLRKVFDRAKARRAAGRGTLLFVDEIHRFNKAQQDGFLPHLESGVITLVGATTENPSFELNAALLSRVQVLVLNALDDAALQALLSRAEEIEGRTLPLTDEARAAVVSLAAGDGRYVLSLAEILFAEPVDRTPIAPDELGDLLQRRAPLYDKSADGHYNLASALQKSIRGSDVDAALYWAARMLVGGEDPRFILRRLVVVASEDVGNADPQALPLAVAARDAYEFLGLPEGEIAIGQLVAYLASAPKSNRSHIAFKEAKAAARKTAHLSPPPHAVNAPTDLMKSMGYSEGYKYDHDQDDGFAGMNYFPTEMDRQQFYRPSNFGFDKEIAKRLDYWAKKRAEKNAQ